MPGMAFRSMNYTARYIHSSKSLSASLYVRRDGEGEGGTVRLGDPILFRQVWVDPEVHALVWPNGADFDRATLHVRPEQVGVVEQLARHWESRAASRFPR